MMRRLNALIRSVRSWEALESHNGPKVGRCGSCNRRTHPEICAADAPSPEEKATVPCSPHHPGQRKECRTRLTVAFRGLWSAGNRKHVRMTAVTRSGTGA
jgi:hypothetical protein